MVMAISKNKLTHKSPDSAYRMVMDARIDVLKERIEFLEEAIDELTNIVKSQDEEIKKLKVSENHFHYHNTHFIKTFPQVASPLPNITCGGSSAQFPTHGGGFTTAPEMS